MEPRPQAGDRSLLSSTLYLKGPKNLLSSPAGWGLGAAIPESQGRTLNVGASFWTIVPGAPLFFSQPQMPPWIFSELPRIHFSCCWLDSPWGRAYSPTRDLLPIRDGPWAGTPHTHLVLGLCLSSPPPRAPAALSETWQTAKESPVSQRGPWGSLPTLPPPEPVTVARGLMGLEAQAQPSLQGSAGSAPRGWSRSRCCPSSPCWGHRVQENSPGVVFSPGPELTERGSD